LFTTKKSISEKDHKDNLFARWLTDDYIVILDFPFSLWSFPLVRSFVWF
jgi:hypothetical protein